MKFITLWLVLGLGIARAHPPETSKSLQRARLWSDKWKADVDLVLLSPSISDFQANQRGILQGPA